MPKATATSEPLYYYEEGWYDARLESVKEDTVTYTAAPRHAAVKAGRAKVGDQLSFDQWIWTYTLLSGERAGSTLEVKTDTTINVNRDDDLIRLQVEAFIGETLTEGREVDTDLYEGQVIQLHIKHLPEGVNPKTQKKTFYTEVDQFAPAGDNAVAAASEGFGSFADEPPF